MLISNSDEIDFSSEVGKGFRSKDFVGDLLIILISCSSSKGVNALIADEQEESDTVKFGTVAFLRFSRIE